MSFLSILAFAAAEAAAPSVLVLACPQPFDPEQCILVGRLEEAEHADDLTMFKISQLETATVEDMQDSLRIQAVYCTSGGYGVSCGQSDVPRWSIKSTETPWDREFHVEDRGFEPGCQWRGYGVRCRIAFARRESDTP